MDKGQLQELIQADLDGELSVAERAVLARLLLQDPEARRLHAEFRRTDQLLRNVAAAEPPPGLRADILAGSAQVPAHGQFRSAAIRPAPLPHGRRHPRGTADRGPQLRPDRRPRAGNEPAGIAHRAAGPSVVAGGRCRDQRLPPARRREAQARTQLVDDDSLRDHREDRPGDDDLCRQDGRCRADRRERPGHRRARRRGAGKSCWISPARRRSSWNCAQVGGCSAKAACRSATPAKSPQNA